MVWTRKPDGIFVFNKRTNLLLLNPFADYNTVPRLPVSVYVYKMKEYMQSVYSAYCVMVLD